METWKSRKPFKNYEKRMRKEGSQNWCSKFDQLHEY